MAVNTIPLPTAEIWQDNWIASENLANDPTKIRSFLIPLADLQQVIEEMGVANARGVLGITPEGEYKLVASSWQNANGPYILTIDSTHDAYKVDGV